jgi:hypothetical protein
MPTWSDNVFQDIPTIDLFYDCMGLNWEKFGDLGLAWSNVRFSPIHDFGEWGAWEQSKEASCEDYGLMTKRRICYKDNEHIDFDSVFVPKLIDCKDEELEALKADTAELNAAVAQLTADNINLRDSIAVLINLLEECENFGVSSALVIPQEQLRVYPNPVSGFQELTISNFNWALGDIVELFDINGKRVYFSRGNTPGSTGGFKIDMSPYPAGSYLLRIGNNIGNKVAKIVKN